MDEPNITHVMIRAKQAEGLYGYNFQLWLDNNFPRLSEEEKEQIREKHHRLLIAYMTSFVGALTEASNMIREEPKGRENVY